VDLRRTLTPSLDAPPIGLFSDLMNKKRPLIFLLMAAALIVAFGFLLSQCERRKTVPLSADDQRVQDILSLSWRVVFYAQTKGRLPSSLSEVEEDTWKIPVDPVTSSPYFYEVLGRDSFRLCAVFLLAAHHDEEQGADFLPSTCHAEGAVCYGAPAGHTYGAWGHRAGKQCLDRRAPFMGMAPSLR
jgi:hypothetical protein